MKLSLALGLETIKTTGGGVSPYPVDAFVIDIKTDNVGTSTSSQVTLPFQSYGAIDITVAWGDGVIDANITAWNDSRFTHTYPIAGEYQVVITGTIRGWRQINAGDKLKMMLIRQWGTFQITNGQAFGGSTNIDCIALDAPIISTDNLLETFWSCPNIVQIGFGWDVSGVYSFQRMLYGCLKMNSSDIPNWDMKTTAWYLWWMLWGCDSFDQSLAPWDITNISNATDFLRYANPGMSTINYDATLLSWASQIPLIVHTPIFDFGDAKYTGGGAVAQARADLISAGVGIIDGGIA